MSLCVYLRVRGHLMCLAFTHKYHQNTYHICTVTSSQSYQQSKSLEVDVVVDDDDDVVVSGGGDVVG